MVDEINKKRAHIWCVHNELFTGCIHKLHKLLSEEERQRADRYYFTEDRERYITTRGLLRILLSWYIKCKPDKVSFIYNDYGKPALSPVCNPADIHFNLSHSRRITLYSFIVNSAIGIDVEYINPKGYNEDIVIGHFSDMEIDAFSRLTDASKTEAFYHCWTRKEAYIKAIGMGLSYPLNHFSVTVQPGQEGTCTRIIKKTGEPDEWHVWTIKPEAGYIGAIAVEGYDIEFVFLHLRPDGVWSRDSFTAISATLGGTGNCP